MTRQDYIFAKLSAHLPAFPNRIGHSVNLVMSRADNQTAWADGGIVCVGDRRGAFGDCSLTYGAHRI